MAAIVICVGITTAMFAQTPQPAAADHSSAKIYVVGNVKKPGIYQCYVKDDCSVFTAIAMAQGLMPYTAPKAYLYRMDATSGKREKIELNLNRILGRKAPDVTLRADDILFIPNKARHSLFPVPSFPIPNDWPTNVQGE